MCSYAHGREFRAPRVPPLSPGQEGISSSKAAADRFRGSLPSAHQATLMLPHHPAPSSLPGLGEEGPTGFFFSAPVGTAAPFALQRARTTSPAPALPGSALAAAPHPMFAQEGTG